MIVARSSPTTSRKRPRRGPTFKRAPACYFCAPFVFITLQIPLPDCPSATAFIFMNLQIPFPANPLFANVYKTPGVSPTGKAHSGPFWNGQQNVLEQKENAPECNSGASTNNETPKCLRAVTVAAASVLESLPVVALVSRPESYRQVRQPSPDTPDRRVSRCLG